MGGLIEPSPLSNPQEESNLRPILIGVVLVVIIVGAVVLFSHETPKTPAAPHPYVASVKLSNLKMSAAENFVGASVTYIDGTVSNDGDQTVIHATVHVTFKNSLDQIAQAEDLPLRVLQTTGPYPDAVDLTISPLAPRQSKQFRLTFEHVSADWNQAYPDVQVTDVAVR
jgi:enamine deaminase RidA (YjgF/YER057c/UK114 family)